LNLRPGAQTRSEHLDAARTRDLLVELVELLDVDEGADVVSLAAATARRST
jgi:hypothetical protein